MKPESLSTVQQSYEIRRGNEKVCCTCIGVPNAQIERFEFCRCGARNHSNFWSVTSNKKICFGPIAPPIEREKCLKNAFNVADYWFRPYAVSGEPGKQKIVSRVRSRNPSVYPPTRVFRRVFQFRAGAIAHGFRQAGYRAAA